MRMTTTFAAIGGALLLAACTPPSTEGEEEADATEESAEDTEETSSLSRDDTAFLEGVIAELEPQLPLNQGALSITNVSLEGGTLLFRAEVSDELVLAASPDEATMCNFRTAGCTDPAMSQAIEHAEELRFDYFEAGGDFVYGLGLQGCEERAGNDECAISYDEPMRN